MKILEVQHVVKTYGSHQNQVTALSDVSFAAEQGEFIAIVGTSGSGKSTLLNLLGGLDVPTEGKISIRGHDIGSLTRKEQTIFRRRNIGFVFQNYSLMPVLNVYDNVALPVTFDKGSHVDREHIRELLNELGLWEKRKRYPSELSGDQQQRAAIARALATSPKILLCDEATSALDPQTTASILELLQEINRKFNITIVIITHQMSVVRKICSHVAIMKSGEIVETGSVSEIFSHPKSDVARELIRKDEGDDVGRAESSGNTKDLIQSGRKVRIVFSENSAFQPVIANMILKFREPVNILRADTRNIGGVAKGEMILEFAGDSRQAEEMQNYLKTCGIELEEVTDDVE